MGRTDTPTILLSVILKYMQILYRYILRRTVAACFFVVTTCSVIASLINLFDILDEVVKQKITPDLILRYLLINYSPRMMELLNVMMVLAGLFTMGELGRKLELVSMRASGLSDGKILKPVMGLAAVLFLSVLIVQIDIIPGLHKDGDEMKSFLRTGQAASTQTTPIYVQLKNVSLQSSGYEPSKEELVDVRLVVLENDKVSEMYYAKKLGKMGQKWKLEEGYYRKIDPPTGQVMKYELFQAASYPVHYPSPSEFIFEAQHRQHMVNWMGFVDLMSERTFSARQEIHRRIALAFSTAFCLLAGAWYGLRMHRFNAARAICLAILIGFTYRLIFDGFLALGMETGSSWACHLANVVLLGSFGFSRFLTAT